MAEAPIIFGGMADPEGQIEREIMQGWPQFLIAQTYAMIMRQCGSGADWPRINRAITERWKGKTALARIKRQAWDRYEGKDQRMALEG